MDSEPTEILASGLCTIDPAIKVLPGAEAYDTANIVMRFANGREATIDVCRQAPYGYDQRAEVLGTTAMIQTDNSYPNTARIYSASFTGMIASQERALAADSSDVRVSEAYRRLTHSPCTMPSYAPRRQC